LDAITVIAVLSIVTSAVNIMSVFLGPMLDVVGAGCGFPVSYVAVITEDAVQIGSSLAIAVRNQGLSWQGILNILGSIVSLYYFMFVELRTVTEENTKKSVSITDSLWFEIQALFANINNTIPIIYEKHIHPKDKHLFKPFTAVSLSQWERIYDEVLSDKAEIDRSYKEISDPQERIYVGLSSLREFASSLNTSYMKSLLLMMPPISRDHTNISDMESYLNRISKKENWVATITDGISAIDDDTNIEEGLVPLVSTTADTFDKYLDSVKNSVSGRYAKLAAAFTIAIVAVGGAVVGIGQA
jgi:hypothetical protein